MGRESDDGLSLNFSREKKLLCLLPLLSLLPCLKSFTFASTILIFQNIGDVGHGIQS